MGISPSFLFMVPIALCLVALGCDRDEAQTQEPKGQGGDAGAGGSAGSSSAGGSSGSSGNAGGSGGSAGSAGAGGAGSGGDAGSAGASGSAGDGGSAGTGGMGGSGGTDVHTRALLIDGHNDLPWEIRLAGGLAAVDLSKNVPGFNTDIPRLRVGNVGAQFWSAYVPTSTMTDGTAVKTTLEQVDLIHQMVATYSDTFELALTPADIRRIRAAGKIASLIGLEGGHSIDGSLTTLNDLFEKGARYMTLSHNKNLEWVESANDVAMSEGLTTFGEEVVREMNRIGMLVDISHISARAMREVLEVVEVPLIASHSSAYALKADPRNVPDDVLEAVAANGGLVAVNFYPVYLARGRGPKPPVDVRTVVNHIEHIIEVAGIDHVGLGSDFDGLPALPEGLEDVSKFPNITTELLARGYSEPDIHKILGENFMRVFEAAEAFASSRKTARPLQRRAVVPGPPSGASLLSGRAAGLSALGARE